MRKIGSESAERLKPVRNLFQALHVPKSQRIWRGPSQADQRCPLFYGTKDKFSAGKYNFIYLAILPGLFGILTEGVDVLVSNKTMPIAALQETFPRESVNSILLPGIFSQIKAIVIL